MTILRQGKRRPLDGRGKERQTAATALLDGLADDGLPAVVLLVQSDGRAHDAARADDGHEARHAQFGALLQHPLEFVLLEAALEEDKVAGGVAGARTLIDDPTGGAARRDALQLDKNLAAVAVDGDDRLSGRQAQHGG